MPLEVDILVFVDSLVFKAKLLEEDPYRKMIDESIILIA